MVLANFIARASAAASQVLQGFNDAAFLARLRKCVVAVAFDDRAAKSAEGVVALKLAVDMLARLYPAITFLDLGGGGPAAALVAELKTGARAIHGRISFDAPVRKALCCVAVGDLAPEVPCPTVFVGSDGWTARLSPTAPRGSADSRNPFGAAAAACFGVANVFRIVFGGQLANGLPDDEFEFDVLHLRRGPSAAPRELPFPLHLGAVHLAGQGAIGRAACWTLSRVPGLEGTLDLVDDETIDRSNLQRYVGAGQRDIDAPKAASAAAMFAASTLRVVPHAATWGGYMAARGNWALDKVAVALDTARDRMAIQAALPRRVLNAWTQPGDLGVSRHGFLEGPCLMCLYLPDREVPHESVLVAKALNLPEREVRLLLHTRAVVDHHLAARIAAARGVQLERLRPFVGLPLASFYAKAVCGSTVFAAPDGGLRGASAVPMAFQSAMAGVLLAAEIVEDAAGLRTGHTLPVGKLDLLRPLARLSTEPFAKEEAGRCICGDPVYRRVYEHKFCSGDNAGPGADGKHLAERNTHNQGDTDRGIYGTSAEWRAVAEWQV